MKSSFIIFLICLSLAYPVFEIHAAPGGSFDEAVPAVVGINRGQISQVGGSYYFSFNATPTSIYDFELQADENVTFDFEIIDEDSFPYTNLAPRVSPNVIRAPGKEFMYIHVFSIEGTGPFNVTITQYPLAKLSEGKNMGMLDPDNKVQGFYLLNYKPDEYKISIEAENPGVYLEMSIVDEFMSNIVNISNEGDEQLILRISHLYTYFLVSGTPNEAYRVYLEKAFSDSPILTISFSGSIQAGDSFEWVVETLPDDNSEKLHTGDVISLSFDLPGPQISYNLSTGEIEPDAIHLQINDVPEEEFEPLVFIIPVDVFYENGGKGGFEEAVFQTHLYPLAVVVSGGISRVLYGGGYTIGYDRETGLMLYISAPDLYIFFNSSLPSPQTTKNETTTPILKIPVDFNWLVASFISISVLIRKKNKMKTISTS